jgi:hypothetical protein
MRKHITYARVCVEIDASKVLVKEFDLQCPNGIVITISAEYEWLPSRSSSCNVYGHNLATCLTTHNDKATLMEDTKKSKVVDRTNLEHNLLNNLQWQEVGKRKKNNHKTMPSSFGTTDGT